MLGMGVVFSGARKKFVLKPWDGEQNNLVPKQSLELYSFSPPQLKYIVLLSKSVI
jgi:hypothetical protein